MNLSVVLLVLVSLMLMVNPFIVATKKALADVRNLTHFIFVKSSGPMVPLSLWGQMTANSRFTSCNEVFLMACFHPLHAFVLGKSPSGKMDIKIASQYANFIYKFKSDTWIPSNVYMPGYVNVGDPMKVPCGKCIGCRLAYARQWADRCMLELQDHDSAYFVTLTYNDEHVPRSAYGDLETGQAHESLTLCRRDVQLFLKRLRFAKSGDKIRYFGCGEYGPSTWRPHYHLILFGLHLDDLQLKRQDVDGKVNAWFSPTLQAAWSERPFGNYSPILDKIGDVECSEVTWSACNYVARYIVKKQLGPDGKDFYETFNLVPPFTFMSTHPGIGRNYYDTHDGIYDTDSISISTPTGGRSIRPPRYFDKLYDIDHPEELAAIKQIRREMAENAERFKLSRTSLSVFELQELEERRMLQKTPKEFDL